MDLKTFEESTSAVLKYFRNICIDYYVDTPESECNLDKEKIKDLYMLIDDLIFMLPDVVMEAVANGNIYDYDEEIRRRALRIAEEQEAKQASEKEKQEYDSLETFKNVINRISAEKVGFILREEGLMYSGHPFVYRFGYNDELINNVILRYGSRKVNSCVKLYSESDNRMIYGIAFAKEIR